MCDQDDIRVLAEAAGLDTAKAILDTAQQVLGPGRLKPGSQFLIEQMFNVDDSTEVSQMETGEIDVAGEP